MLRSGIADRARLTPLGVAAVVLVFAGFVAAWSHRVPADPTLERSRLDSRTGERSAVDPASSGNEPRTSRSNPDDGSVPVTSDRAAADTSGRDPAPGRGGPEPAATPGSAAGDTPPAPTRARTIEFPDVAAPVSVASGVPAGAYLLTATLTGSSERVQVTVGDERAGEFFVDGPRELTVPVHVRGESDVIGVRSADEAEAEAESIRVSRLHLQPSTAGYTARGAAIIDPSGRAVIQRGVNRPGLQTSAAPENLTRSDFEAMRNAGVEIVRLKLGQHLWLPGFCDHDRGYHAAVDRAVDSITSLGLVALLDLAWTVGGETCGEPGLKVMPDEYSVTFWEQVAARYHANPLVAFNIFNEPGDVNRQMWRDGGTVSQQVGIIRTREWEAVGMQRLYDTVRSTGARNLIYVSGTGYSHDLRPALSHPLDGYGLVYGAHIYCHDCNHLPPIVSSGIEPVIGEYPVTVTEFGTQGPSGVFNERVIEWSEQRGIGWQAFMWLPRSLGAYGLLDSWDTYGPSPVGKPVLDALRRPYGR